METQQVALPAAERRAGHLAVVGPGGEEDARRHLDLLIGCDDIPLAHGAAIVGRRLSAPVERFEEIRRIEPRQIHFAHQAAVLAVSHAGARGQLVRRGQYFVAVSGVRLLTGRAADQCQSGRASQRESLREKVTSSKSWDGLIVHNHTSFVLPNT